MTESMGATCRWPDLDSLRAAVAAVSAEATVSEGFGDVTVCVPVDQWIAALTALRDSVGLTYFDWLSAVDEGDSFSIYCHLYAPDRLGHVLVLTKLPAENPALDTATGVFRGAAWHERETHEMFGIAFPGHSHLKPLLLSDEFVGHPLRKDFVLTARVSKSWPGAKEPGGSGDGSPSRRKMQPPGVPDPEWGPHPVGGDRG
jgi:NADH-quinone oxidoreductase subunit C